MQKIDLFLQVLTLLFALVPYFQLFGMFPKDGQLPVDEFRHQNFGIWTFLGEVMAILAKK